MSAALLWTRKCYLALSLSGLAPKASYDLGYETESYAEQAMPKYVLYR